MVPGRDLGSESEGVVYAEEGFGFIDRVRWVGVGPDLSEDAVGFFDDVLVLYVVEGLVELSATWQQCTTAPSSSVRDGCR